MQRSRLVCWSFCLAVVVIALSGCGQKGPLFLPAKSSQQQDK
ncbi:MAG: lipoprotein [Gammaproteobacteria bacterium]